MREFKDREGDRWKIDLTVGAIVRVRNASGGQFDLFDPMQGELAKKLQDELLTFWEMLWHLVEPQATAKQIDSAEVFGERMAGDCLYDAQTKFFEEWRDFFHQLQQPQKATVLEKLAAWNAKALELAKAKLSDPRLATIDQRMEAKMSQVLNDSFGKTLESLDAILAPTPGGNSGA